MSAMLTPKWKQISSNRVGFYCPGCDDIHMIDTDRWAFTFKNDKGTISPSVLVKSGHFADHFKAEDNCWCKYYAEHPKEEPVYKCGVCHLFLVDDVISYLTDSTHAYAGKVIPLPDFPIRN
jgi:Family of unknown function (DUF6527)